MTIIERAKQADTQGEIDSVIDAWEKVRIVTRLYQVATNGRHDVLEVVDAVKHEIGVNNG